MAEATYDMLLDWAESQLGSFDRYDKLSELEEDLLSAPDKANHVDGRTAHAKKLLTEWFEGNLDVKGYDADEIKGTVIDKETRDIMEDIQSARIDTDLDKISISGLSEASREQAEGLIEGKRGELLESGKEAVEKEFRDALASATGPAVDIPYSIGELRRNFGKEFASEMSEAVAERTEELFDLAQQKVP